MNALNATIDVEGRVTISQTRDAHDLRKQLGTTAWTVLEVLCVEAALVDDVLTVALTARDVGRVLGISKDRVTAALNHLITAGLIVRCARRDRQSALFVESRYEIWVPITGDSTNELIAEVALVETDCETETPASRRDVTIERDADRARRRSRGAKRSVERGVEGVTGQLFEFDQ